MMNSILMGTICKYNFIYMRRPRPIISSFVLSFHYNKLLSPLTLAFELRLTLMRRQKTHIEVNKNNVKKDIN